MSTDKEKCHFCQKEIDPDGDYDSWGGVFMFCDGECRNSWLNSLKNYPNILEEELPKIWNNGND